MTPSLPPLVAAALGSPFLLIPAISISSMFLEDPTIVGVGIISSLGAISPVIALVSLYVGVVCGDTLFFMLGRLARSHPRLRTYLNHTHLEPFRLWLESKYVITLFTARFIPGSRLPTYAASGYFGIPLRTFVAISICATAIWTTTLFSLAYLFGAVVEVWLAAGQWPLALFVFIVLVLSGRKVLHTIADRYVLYRDNDTQRP